MAEPRPLVIVAPEPRRIPEIFRPEAEATLRRRYELVEIAAEAVADAPDDLLRRARYVLGQPPLSSATLARMPALRAVLNVEGNLLPNMDYAAAFTQGARVLVASPVFAEPVAEIGLCFALALARDVVEADAAFREGRELYGFEGNRDARLMGGSEIGFIGFGDIGRALMRLLSGFRARIRAYDPWLPDAVLAELGVEAASLDTVLRESDTVFCVASVTAENAGFLDADAFAAMRSGAGFVLLSRAAVVDFPAMLDAAARGHIRVATDVFPTEPVPASDPLRAQRGLIRSAHRAGALDAIMLRMGDMALDDMALMDQGLPPMRMKRAEPETAAMMRGKPVDKT